MLHVTHSMSMCISYMQGLQLAYGVSVAPAKHSEALS